MARARERDYTPHPSTALCKILQAKLREFLQIFPKMADWQVKAGLSSLAALRRENSNMEESFYTTLYNLTHSLLSSARRRLIERPLSATNTEE